LGYASFLAFDDLEESDLGGGGYFTPAFFYGRKRKGTDGVFLARTIEAYSYWRGEKENPKEEGMAIKVEEQAKKQVDTLYQLLETFFPPLPAKAAKLMRRERNWELRWEPQRGKMKVVTIDLAIERIAVSIPARVNIPPFSIANRPGSQQRS
jgi:hypothetical protein